jgi:phosphoenolpyruvate carboxykinase (ATP)
VRSDFNLEDGCYAKVIGLSPTAELDIFMYQAIWYHPENVVYDPVTQVDLDDDTLTENTCIIPTQLYYKR